MPSFVRYNHMLVLRHKSSVITVSSTISGGSYYHIIIIIIISPSPNDWWVVEAPVTFFYNSLPLHAVFGSNLWFSKIGLSILWCYLPTSYIDFIFWHSPLECNLGKAVWSADMAIPPHLAILTVTRSSNCLNPAMQFVICNMVFVWDLGDALKACQLLGLYSFLQIMS